MTNPYETPDDVRGQAADVPGWYLLFCKVYWPGWWGGTVLIALSWADYVPQIVGWLRAGLAVFVVIGARVFPKLAGIEAAQEVVALDSRMLRSKDASCRQAFERFAAGVSLMYDSVHLYLRPDNEVVGGVVSPDSLDSTNEQVMRDVAEHAQAVFDQLKAESPEFAAAVAGHPFRISVMSSYEPGAHEICRVLDGVFEWKKKPRGAGVG